MAVVSFPVQGLQPGHGTPIPGDIKEGDDTHATSGIGRKSGKSWAAVLGSSLPRYEDNNVLEVVLEKDVKGSFSVSDSDCVSLIRRLGLDTRPGVNVQGVQICPNGRGVIYLTLKKEIDIGRFCRYDVFEVNSSGVRAINVKPAGKKEVVVSVKGLHPNTRDTTVTNYLKHFCEVVSNKVIHGVYSDGPLKGMHNGDRSYKVEIKSSISLGSYHVLDGHKISIKYPGQLQTCARCLQSSQLCKGKGLARKCEIEGGLKADFLSYILELWTKIGYTPESSTELEDAEDFDVQEGGHFTPVKVPSCPEKFNGVCVRQFPKNADHGEIIEFLVRNGLPESKKENVSISGNGTALIKDIENSDCLLLIGAIHQKIHFTRQMYCNGIIPLSPLKNNIAENNVPDKCPQIQEPVHELFPKLAPANDLQKQEPTSVLLPSSASANIVQQQELTVPVDNAQIQEPTDVQLPSLASASDGLSQPISTKCDDSEWPSVPILVRRHSLSIHNRKSNSGVLATDLLSVKLRNQTSHILNSGSDLTETASDFNSCYSAHGSSSEEDISKVSPLSKKKRRKRCRQSSPPTDDNQKRVNLGIGLSEPKN